MLARRLCLVLVAASPALAVAGSGLRDGKPDWISGDSLDYPRHMVLSGVGSADDRATAEDRARAELARIFSTRVVSTTSSYAEETSRSAGGRSDSARVNAVSDATASSADKVLEGVVISATWQDPATHVVYALATLDRRQARARLEAGLEAIEAKLRPLAREVKAEDRMAAARAALRYRALAKRRDPVVADLRVVTGDAVAAAPENPDVAKALGRLVVVVDARQAPGPLGVAVTRALLASGISARPLADDAPADVEARVEATTENLGLKDGWTWARCEATVTVTERGTGRAWARLRDSERQAATQPAEAPGRAVKALAARIESALPGELEAGTEAR
jgi:hypothetical protein